MLEALADQLVVILEKARLFEGERRRAERLAALNSIGRLITASLSMKDMLVTATEAIRAQMQFSSVSVFLIDPNTPDTLALRARSSYRHLQQITSIRGWPEWGVLWPALPTAEAKPSLWTDLQQKTNPALWVPKPAEGMEAHPLEERGQKLWVLKHRATNTYLRVSAEDHFVWTQIDGQRTIVKLSIVYAMKYNPMTLGRIQHLVELLQDKGLVTGGVADKVYGPLQNKLAAAGGVGKLRQGFGWLMSVLGVAGLVLYPSVWAVCKRQEQFFKFTPRQASQRREFLRFSLEGLIS